MEIAFHSLLIVVFIIFPGAVLRRFFYQGEFSKQYDSQSWYHTVFLSAVLGVFVHALTSLLFYNAFIPIEKNYFLDVINLFLNEDYDPEIIDDYGVKELKLVSYYSCLVIAVAIGLGVLGFWTIRAFGWDLSPILRFNNHWHYYFSGEIIKTKDFENIKKEGKIIYTLADVLVKTGESTSTLYTGILNQHTINKDNGRLENIYLTNVSRFKSGYGVDYQPFSKEIPGDIFIVPHDRIINLNLKYIVQKKPPFKYYPILNFFLIIGYFLIWADVWEWFSMLPISIKGGLKLFLHSFWWILLSLIFLFIFRRRNSIPEKEIIAHFILLGIVLVLFLIFLKINWMIILANIDLGIPS